MYKLLLNLLLLAVFLVACAPAENSPEAQSFTIGLLDAPVRTPNVMFDGFKAGMAERGYIEGENVTYIVQRPESPDFYDEAAQALVDADVDLIFALARVEGLAAKAATTEIPIVFGPSYFPVESGLVEALDHPNGNATGLFLSDSSERRLELLVEAMPDADTILVLYDPNDPLSASITSSSQETANNLDVELVLYELTDGESAVHAMETLPEGVDAVYMTPARIMFASNPAWLDMALEHNLLVAHFAGVIDYPQFFMGYGTVPFEAGKQASRLAAQILEGANPADLPVEPAELYLAINLGLAEELGHVVPESTLQQADTIVRAEED